MSTGLYSGVSGLALGVGLYKGVQGLWGGASGLIAGDGSSLSLDFLTSNTLDPRVTFTRSTTATFVGSNGLIQTAAINAPRFDYSPVTLVPNGLLIEEQRVNLATNSEAVGLWAGFTGATASSNVAVAPDGTITADKLVESATLNSHFVSQTSASVSYTSGTTYVRSCWLKADGRRYVSLFLPGTNFPTTGRVAIFDLQTGVVQAVESGVTATITSFANSWYRCTISAVANATGSGHAGGSALFDNTGQGLYTGDGVSGALIWGAQTEAGAFATSYIPTAASTVTRTVDIASMTGTNFSSWYNQSEGTIVAQFVATTTGVTSTGGSAFPFVYEIDSAAASNSSNQLILSSGYGPGWNASTTILGVTQASLQASMSLGNTSVRKIAYAYRTNDFAASANGGAVVTDTSGTLPSPDRIGIGCQNSDGGNSLTGYIRTLTFYPSRLTNAQLQALTA